MEKSGFLSERYVKIYKITGVTAAVYLAFRYALPLFAPFVAAYLLAALIRPAVMYLHRTLHIPVGMGGALLLLLLSGGILCGVVFLGKMFVEQAARLVERFPVYRGMFLTSAERFCNRMDGWLSLEAGTTGDVMYMGLERIGSAVNEEMLPELSKQSLQILGSAAYAVAGLMIAFVAAVLLLGHRKDYEKSKKNNPFQEEIRAISGRLSAAGVAYLKTQIILMLLIAGVCTVGFLLIKNEYALLLGIAVAIFDAFPVLGSGLILVPWALVCLLKANYGKAAVLTIIYLLCVFIREGLEPKLLGDRIGIPPLYTLMAVYVGMELFGFPGVILGPFGLVVIRAVYEEL